MNRTELIRIVADKLAVNQSEVRAILVETMIEIAEAVRQEGRVDLRAFGVFELKQRAARTGRDPRDGSPIPIPAKKTVRFKAAPGLERYLQTPAGKRPRRWLG